MTRSTSRRPRRWRARTLIGALAATVALAGGVGVLAPASAVAMMDINCEELGDCSGGGGWEGVEEGGWGWGEGGGWGEDAEELEEREDAEEEAQGDNEGEEAERQAEELGELGREEEKAEEDEQRLAEEPETSSEVELREGYERQVREEILEEERARYRRDLEEREQRAREALKHQQELEDQGYRLVPGRSGVETWEKVRPPKRQPSSHGSRRKGRGHAEAAGVPPRRTRGRDGSPPLPAATSNRPPTAPRSAGSPVA